MRIQENRAYTRASYIRLTNILFLGIWFAIFLSTLVSAQMSNYSILKKQVADVTKKIAAKQSQQDDLLRKNKEYTDRINATKLKLQKDSNLLLERRLQGDLKKSRQLADEMQKLDKEIYSLTKQSVELKKRLVDLLSVEIDRLTQEANSTVNSKKKLEQIQRALELQKEKESYYSQITEESNELLLALEVTIEEDDGPDDILRKVAIVEDQQDIIRGKVRELDTQIQSIQKNIGLQRSMLELMRDIGRGEEDEMDLDRSTRIAERQEQIADMEADLQVMKAKKEMWQARDRVLAEKIEKFHQELSNLLNPAPKGDQGESR